MRDEEPVRNPDGSVSLGWALIHWAGARFIREAKNTPEFMATLDREYDRAFRVHDPYVMRSVAELLGDA